MPDSPLLWKTAWRNLCADWLLSETDGAWQGEYSEGEERGDVAAGAWSCERREQKVNFSYFYFDEYRQCLKLGLRWVYPGEGCRMNTESSLLLVTSHRPLLVHSLKETSSHHCVSTSGYVKCLGGSHWAKYRYNLSSIIDAWFIILEPYYPSPLPVQQFNVEIKMKSLFSSFFFLPLNYLNLMWQ